MMSATAKEYFSNYQNFSQEQKEYARCILHKLHGFGLVSQEELDFYSNLFLNAEETAA